MAEELSELGKRAWVGFFVAHGVMVREIDHRLQAAGCITLDVYDVLLVLEEAPERRLRMSELAERVLFSRSGVTRLVDRLEKFGWIRREACPNDRRACHATLTDAGLAEREKAWPVFRQAIYELFSSKLSDEEAQQMGEAFERMIGGMAPGSCGSELKES